MATVHRANAIQNTAAAGAAGPPARRPALARAKLAIPGDAQRLVFQSIGTATPSNIAAIAVGLGVPVSVVMEAVYRAPSVLVDGLTLEAGRQMHTLLRELGCDVCLEPQNAPDPAAPALFDVALHISSTGRYGEIARALADFIGATEDDAGRLLSTPPGVVLGKVSQATISALEARLGDGVALLSSQPDAALYDVFLGPCDSAARSRLLADLRRRGLTPLGDSGCILSGLSRHEADRLWSTHQRLSALRIVNRDFLRFDLVLLGGEVSPASTRALIEVAGIPARLVPRLLDSGEITVMEAVPHGRLARVLETLTEAGLQLRAELITFLHLGLEITEAAAPHVVADKLRSLGLKTHATDLRRLPYRLPWHLPQLQARMLRDSLESCGARVDLIEHEDSA